MKRILSVDVYSNVDDVSLPLIQESSKPSERQDARALIIDGVLFESYLKWWTEKYGGDIYC